MPHEILSDEYLREIGRVAVEWTRVESTVESIIWAFLFVDYADTSPWLREEDGRAITTHINLLLRVDVMLSLASNSFKELPTCLGDFEDAAKAIRSTYPKRNKVVHGEWTPLQGQALRSVYRARGDVKPFYDFMTPGDISAIASECQALAAHLARLSQRLVPLLLELRTESWQRDRQ
ncbi:MAG TPA: hypothetical protein VGF92_08360 [Stellaceae bacterium]|jgi:hypothetical protein